jgi:hypothetical protein
MNFFEVKWKSRKKYGVNVERTSTIEARNKKDAKGIFRKNCGSESKTEVLSFTEICVPESDKQIKS